MTNEEIDAWLSKYRIENYFIESKTQYVHVAGNVYLNKKALSMIPIQFGIVEGDFHCAYNYLLSLKGTPHVVKGDFNFSRNYVKNLEYCPKIIEGNFDASHNKVNSMKGLPLLLGEVKFENNEITHLESLSSGIKHLYMTHNKLQSYDTTLFDLINLESIYFANIYTQKNFYSKDRQEIQEYLTTLRTEFENKKFNDLIKDTQIKTTLKI
jgi:hypothetical protein